MKIKKLVVLSLLFLGFSSCDDQLDIVQPSEINEAVIFSSIPTFRNALNTVYASFPYQNTMIFNAVWTDEIKIGLTNGGQGITNGEHGYVLNDQSGDAGSIWNSHHRMINLANRVIVGAPSVPVTSPAEEAQVKDIVAQARFLRALTLIQVMPYFTTDLADNAALSIIAFEDVPQTTAKRPRSTNGEVYAIIEADLTYAEANLATRTGDDALRFANLNGCKAIRARMALYRKQYPQAQQLAQDLIDVVPLSPRAQYTAMWSDANNNERIFFIARQVGNASFSGLFSNVGPGIGKNNWYEMGRGLFEKYAMNDIRRSAFTGLNDNSNVSTLGISSVSPNPNTDPAYRENDQICINKYPGKSNVPYLADFKIFRVAEMYMIKAEAQIAQNNLSGAAETLKAVRDARHTTVQPLPNYGSQQAAYQDLLLERRKEFCFEAMRYIDIKRLGQVANVTFDRFFRDCAINNSCTPPAPGDHRFTMPIPNSERNANPNVVQNPNY